MIPHERRFHFRKTIKTAKKGTLKKTAKKKGRPLKTLKKKGDTFQNPKYLVRILDFSPKLKNT